MRTKILYKTNQPREISHNGKANTTDHNKLNFKGRQQVANE